MATPKTDQEVIELLKRTRDSIIDRRNEVLSKPKPNYDIDGQKVDWATYLDMLTRSLKSVNEEILLAENQEPYEFSTEAYQ